VYLTPIRRPKDAQAVALAVFPVAHEHIAVGVTDHAISVEFSVLHIASKPRSAWIQPRLDASVLGVQLGDNLFGGWSLVQVVQRALLAVLTATEQLLLAYPGERQFGAGVVANDVDSS
jgi:hypothetical protein